MKYIHREIGFYEVADKLSNNFGIGTTLSEYKEGKFVLLSKEQEDFCADNPTATPVEVFNMELNPIPEILISTIKQQKVFEIDNYDKSLEINSFYINGNSMWIDRDTRVSLYHTASIISEGNIKLWTQDFNPTSFELDINTFKTLLESLEIYAKTAYDVTAQHKYNVNQLTSIEEIETYDYKVGYPEKINITL